VEYQDGKIITSLDYTSIETIAYFEYIYIAIARFRKENTLKMLIYHKV